MNKDCGVLKKDISQKEMLYWSGFVAIMALIACLAFYRLDVKYVDPYDEARHGVNAYEMLRQGTLVESTYLYETDYYNLKPPLSMWCIMISFLIFGKNVFALRAYSAICYLLLAVAVGLFVKKHFGRLESLFAMAFLAANTAPFAAHMIRAGDADSLYVLLFTLAMLCMLEIPIKQNRLYLCGLFFALAFLTKSFHAGIIVVIGGLFLLLTGELKKMKPKTLLCFAGVTILPIGIWAVMRFFADGVDFFRQMLLVDVLNRTSGVMNNNKQPFGWYAEYFFGTMSGTLTVYLFALAICIMGAVLYSHLFTKQSYKKVVGYILWFMLPFLAFSAVTNKLVWYMYPVTIPLLMCAGIVMARVIKRKETVAVMKIGLFLMTGLILGHFVKSEITVMQTQGGNMFQDFVTEIAKQYREQGYEAYVTLSDGESGLKQEWAQQDVYLAEVYGDLICKDGGYEAFFQAEKGILFVSEEKAQLVCEIILQSGEVCEKIAGPGYYAVIKDGD